MKLAIVIFGSNFRNSQRTHTRNNEIRSKINDEFINFILNLKKSLDKIFSQFSHIMISKFFIKLTINKQVTRM
jgi:hypothetical protein